MMMSNKNKSNNIVFHHVVPDANRDEILSAITYLHQQISEIGHYPDKSLFFQNPLIIDGWLVLVRAIEKNKDSGLSLIVFPEDFDVVDAWEKRTEPFVAFLLTMRELHAKYKKLYKEYYDQLHDLLECYSGWLEGKCISSDGMAALSADEYGVDLKDVEDITQYLTKLNDNSLKARSSVHSVLTDFYFLLMAIMNRGGKIVISMNPSVEDFAMAMDYDLREWTKHFGKEMLDDMKEELNRYYKVHRTDHNTIEIWSDMLVADEDALKMAKRQQLAECDAEKQEHWGEDMKKQMDENGRLMQQILSSCRSEKLLDLGNEEKVEPFIELLTPDNLNMFYDIIVRRSLIQCEMFPELKAQHEEWLNKGNGQEESENELQNNISSACEIPAELMTEEAQPLWEKLRDAGFIVADGYALAKSVSNNQAAYIADCMSEKLKIKYKWKVFEQLWNIENMAQLAGSWKQTGKLPPRANEIEEITE